MATAPRPIKSVHATTAAETEPDNTEIVRAALETTNDDVVENTTEPPQVAEHKVVVENSIAPVAKASSVDPDVKRMQDYIAKYKETFAPFSPGLTPPSALLSAASTLAAMVEQICRYAKPEVIDVFFDFITKDDLGDEKKIYRGLQHLPVSQLNKISTLIGLFHRCKPPRNKGPVNTDTINTHLNTHGKGADIIAYYNMKNK